MVHSEFDDCAQAWPTDTLVFTLPNHTLSAPLSCETFRGEPATRRFDWSFAPTPRSHDRFERQNRYVPPPAFPQASHCPGIAHRLSGLTTRTKSHFMLARPVNSLARVSRRVQHVAFRMLDFTSLPLQQIASFTVLIRYRSLVVFSLRCLQPPVHTALPNSATQNNGLTVRPITLCGHLFQDVTRLPLQLACAITIGAILTSLAATIKITVVFFSTL